MPGPLARLVCSRRSKWVVAAVWLALVAALAVPGSKLIDIVRDQVATADALPDDSPSGQLSDRLQEDFPGGEPFPALVVYRRAGGLSAGDRERIATDARAAASIPHAGRPVPAFQPGSPAELVSPGGEVALTILPLLTSDEEERTDAVERLREITGEGADGLAVRVTGAAALQSDLTTALEAVDAPLLVATAALVLFLLLVIYRSPVIALVPLAVVGFSYAIASGIVYLYADATGDVIDRTATTILAILMFGAGTDYCLLLVARYSARLRETDDEHEAMAGALPQAVPAIVASGVTVVAALLTLLLASHKTAQVVGPVNAVGIAVVLVASVTLLPALLTIVGRRGFWPSGAAVRPRLPTGVEPKLRPELGPLPAALREHSARGIVRDREGIWVRIARRVIGRPVLALVLGVVLIASGGLGLQAARVDTDLIEQFRKTTDSTEGFDLLRKGFPAGAVYPTTVLLESTSGPVGEEDVAAATAQLRDVGGIAAVSEVTGRSRDGSAVTFSVTMADDPFGDAALERVRRMRSALADLGPGVRALVGDGSGNRLDFKEAASDDRKLVFPLVLGLILLILIALLRALVAPLYLLVTVVVSYFGTLGLSALFLQEVLGQDGFEPAVPLLTFVFLVALGVDYNIFLMSAVRDEVRERGTRGAVVHAVGITGPVITSAGLILAGTFAVLTVLPVTVLLQVGFTVALGLLIDTFVVRTVVVPAVAALLGDRIWWPSRP
jgi:RND superfamily putative drug exporter